MDKYFILVYQNNQTYRAFTDNQGVMDILKFTSADVLRSSTFQMALLSEDGGILWRDINDSTVDEIIKEGKRGRERPVYSPTMFIS